MSHRDRSKKQHDPCHMPSPAEVKAARGWAGLSQREAADRVCGSQRAWENWEQPKGSAEHRPMHSGLWRLFLLEIGLDPDVALAPQLRKLEPNRRDVDGRVARVEKPRVEKA